MFFKTGAPKNFAIFTGKQLLESLFNKVTGLSSHGMWPTIEGIKAPDNSGIPAPAKWSNWLFLSYLNLTSHHTLHYLWSADLSKKLLSN